MGQARILVKNISIRWIAQTDQEAFKDLRLEALREHPTAFGTDYDQDRQDADSVWAERLQKAIDQPTGAIVLADAEGELAGMMGVYRDLGTKVRHKAVIWGVYVRPKYRGRNLTCQMMDQILDWCRSKEVCGVRLTVMTDNLRAIRCYQRCGFTVYGMSPEEICVGGKYYDELLMYRRV
jgi:RimJ/RimL family protein N-acetyltransferase